MDQTVQTDRWTPAEAEAFREAGGPVAGEIAFGQDRDGRIRFWTRRAEETYGYAEGDIAGEPVDRLLPHGLANRWHETAQRLLQGEPVEGHRTVHVTRDGTHLEVVVDFAPVVNGNARPAGFITIVRDVQRRVPTKTILANSDAWTRAVVETAVDGIIAINEFGTVQYVNPAARRMFGYEASEVVGNNVSMLMPSPDREQHDTYLHNYRATGVARVIGVGREVMGRRKDGSLLPLELSVSEVSLDGRQLFVGILHDISRRKQAEEEKDQLLQHLNKRNIEITCLYRVGESCRSRRVLSDIFQDVVRVVRPAFLHPDCCRVRVEFDGDTFHEEPFEATDWRLGSEIVVAGRVRGTITVYYLEECGEREIGPFLDEEQELLGAIARALGETVERREAEAQVIQASKLASIGELAAGVGHEINNPVNGIMNCADILMQQFETGDKNHRFAELVRSEAERIAGIVRNLLTFARQDKEHHSPARACDIVETVLSLSRKRIAKSAVKLHVEVPEDLPKIRCRSEQIQQVIMNLIINALHALDDRYPAADPDKQLIITAHPLSRNGGEFVRITVEDHGTGITRANLQRLFDPFFTTKGRDTGTGLGLSVSDGIVKEHGGLITVESTAGEFARFHVDLPQEPPSPAPVGGGEPAQAG